MDAEASHPVVLVVHVPEESLVSVRRDGASTSDETSRRTHAVQVQICDIKTHIEVLGHVPLRPRTNIPGRPVVVAAEVCNRQCACSAIAIAFQHAKDSIRLAV